MAAMTRKPRGLTSQMEQLIESALAPGRFISYNANYDFVSDLEAVEKQIADLVSSEPQIAVSLYETFLAGCNEKAEEIDDSTGSLGQFVDELFCGWIKARQAAGADPDETATRLLAWMDDDPYGFCHGLEKDAAKVFNKAGLAAFETQVRARFDAAATLAPAPGDSFRRNPDYQRRRCGDMLRTVYFAQKNVDAFVILSEATGLAAKDCHALATMLVARRKPAEALAWVERGLALDKKDPHGSMAGHDLGEYLEQEPDPTDPLKKSASPIMMAPSMTSEPPVWAPNRTCPAMPPAPWQSGIPPKGAESRFMSPWETAIMRSLTGRSG